MAVSFHKDGYAHSKHFFDVTRNQPLRNAQDNLFNDKFADVPVHQLCKMIDDAYHSEVEVPMIDILEMVRELNNRVLYTSI